MAIQDTNTASPDALALAALGWIVSDGDRARRLLDTTGLDPDQLRAGLGDSALLAAILRFLEAHEPDLIACADDIDTTPARLVSVRQALEETI